MSTTAEPLSLTRDDIRASILNLIHEETGAVLDSLQDDLQLRTELGLDSVDIVGVVMQIEREYRIRLSHEELVAAQSAGQLIDLVYDKASISNSDT